MPLRKLGNLANLNRHGQNALPNTARCTDRKRTAQTGTENHVPTASSRQRKRKKLKKTRSPSPNASNSDVSGHSTASRQSLPRRVLASIVNLVSPSRPSRRSSPTCSVSSEDFSHLEAPFSHFDTPNDTPVNDNPPSTSAADFETDPAAIDIPQGEGEAYAAAPLDPEEDDQDDLEEEERAIPGGPGISWDHRKPPTEVMALEALEAIQLLLYVPPAEGKRKRKIPTKINGWSRIKYPRAMDGIFRPGHGRD
ncbi:hypothetical protein B0H16DRAFT_1449927 [Mycena metata]|uniref:Uncharacterized protein n=1 Tax=Mycena metata TaxID=1033252 RepID=A0AAD7NUJ9_9AGAR|nr:hypothetical protein B0H16DRAFT_1449927 [Mycena metata]